MKLYSLEMLQQAFSLSFPVLISLIFSFFSVSTADSNVYVQCSQLNFTSTTPFESNVNSLLSSLIDSTSVYNFNKYEISPQNDGVYGLFQCRGDLSSPDCKGCVANAISQLKSICPMSTGGEIQLDRCYVKYDNTSFFGGQDKAEACRRCGPTIGYNSDILNRIEIALAHLVNGNSEFFRAGDFGSIQGVAQCVQDLSLSDCQDCLLEASGRLRSECETSAWADMYLGKCYIQYANQGNGNLGNNDNYAPCRSDSGGLTTNDVIQYSLNVFSIVLTALVTYLGNQRVQDVKVDVKERLKIVIKTAAEKAEITVDKRVEIKVVEEVEKAFNNKISQVYSCYPPYAHMPGPPPRSYMPC